MANSYNYKNNIKTKLHNKLWADATKIDCKHLVSSTSADVRLAAWPKMPFTLTVVDTVTDELEILTCRSVAQHYSNFISFNCLRAREDTVARDFDTATTSVEHRLTAAALNRVEDNVTYFNNAFGTIEENVNNLSSMLLGSIVTSFCSSTYVPAGCVPCNGAEYSEAQFPDFWFYYLNSSTGDPTPLLTCTYAEWTAQVALTGNCAKFAVDPSNYVFKVPLLKDGDSITQASSAAELGKSVKAGLPNATGTLTFANSTGTVPVGVVSPSASGVFSATGEYNVRYPSPTTGGGAYSASNFSLAASNPIYGNSTTVTDEQIRLRHFVVVASAQNNASVFDWSNYMAGLAGKLNADFSNAPQNRPYIIDSWESTNRGLWYKKWSDGLIEQGIAGKGGATITFPTPFLRSDKSRFYKVGLISSNPAAYSPTFVVQSDSLTGAVVSARVDGVNNTGLYWTLEVSGY